MDKKVTHKSIQLSVATWKVLTKLKFDLEKPNIDGVVRDLLEDAGYAVGDILKGVR